MISMKSGAFNEAPPTNAPSTLGSDNNSLLFDGLTEPPWNKKRGQITSGNPMIDNLSRCMAMGRPNPVI